MNELRYAICPDCQESLLTQDSLQICPGCGLTFNVEPATIMPARQTITTRLVRIAEILAEHSIYQNEWAPPPEPERYLAVEYSDDDAVWAYCDDALEELKAAIMMSDTDRDDVKVYDLDTQTVYLPVWTLSHFVAG
jgi:hypothetical protein